MDQHSPAPTIYVETPQNGLGDFTWDSLAAFINLGATIVLLAITAISVRAALDAAKAAHPNPGCSRGLNPPVSSRDLAM